MAGPKSNFPMPPGPMSQPLRNFAANKFSSQVGLPNASDHDGIAGEFAKSAAYLNGLLYLFIAANLDDQHLQKRSQQIDAGIKNAGGVLVSRVTVQRPDSAGNMLPEYIGIDVIGFGNDEMDAKSKSDRKVDDLECISVGSATYCASKSELEENLAKQRGQCTIANPSGISPKEGAQLTASPEGMNSAYSAQMAQKLMPVVRNNPKNEKGGLVLHEAYVERQLIFIPKENWDAKKAAWKK